MHAKVLLTLPEPAPVLRMLQEQSRILRRFRAGDLNLLVSTAGKPVLQLAVPPPPMSLGKLHAPPRSLVRDACPRNHHPLPPRLPRSG